MERKTTKYAVRYKLYLMLGSRQEKRQGKLRDKRDKAQQRELHWNRKSDKEFEKMFRIWTLANETDKVKP